MRCGCLPSSHPSLLRVAVSCFFSQRVACFTHSVGRVVFACLVVLVGCGRVFRGFSPGVGCCGVDIFGLVGAGLAACSRRGVN